MRSARRYWVASLVFAGAVATLTMSWFGREAVLGEGQSAFPPELLPHSAAGFNVLVITLDTTRADRLGCYGYDQAMTPALDSLAASGIRFADAVAPTPITLPSHASIFTGLSPPHHGVRVNGSNRLGASEQTLAELLRSEGYATAAFVSSFALDARFGLDQGFDHYDCAIDTPERREGTQRSKRLAQNVSEAAIDWLGERDKHQPFFAWVHYMDPHEPYILPPPFAGWFEDRPYDGEIAYMDSQLGRLLDVVSEPDLKDNTLIIVAGDHGESLGAHQEPTHSLFIYEATQHVPLLLSCPGLFRRPYVVDDVVVSITDVFPTVVSLLGIDFAGPMDGVSLLQAPGGTDRMVYMEAMAPYFEHGWAPLHGLRRHADKYILAPRSEYYDLHRDPSELDNLYPTTPSSSWTSMAELKAELERRLAQWPSLEEIGASMQGMDAEAIRRLEGLGYVSDVPIDGTTPHLDPKDMIQVSVMLRAASVLIGRRDLDEALAVVREAQRHSPGDRRVLVLLGDILSLQGHYQQAEKAYRSCNDIQPSADGWVSLAQMLVAQRRYDEAELILQQAVELEYNHGGIYLVRGDMLAGQGKADEAADEYERAARLDPFRAATRAQIRIQALRDRDFPSAP